MLDATRTGCLPDFVFDRADLSSSHRAIIQQITRVLARLMITLVCTSRLSADLLMVLPFCHPSHLHHRLKQSLTRTCRTIITSFTR